jgi:hypothetical protein
MGTVFFYASYRTTETDERYKYLSDLPLALS